MDWIGICNSRDEIGDFYLSPLMHFAEPHTNASTFGGTFVHRLGLQTPYAMTLEK